VLSALVAGGHVLLEAVPGTAKTILARAIAASVDGIQFSRIQCTPDLQPTDATGLSIYDQERRSFVFQPGPLFANVVLVDEINRATPKTQSALLEAMAEHQTTTDGVTRPLPDPFLPIATRT
jgi:MoxR-like ATPase